MKNKLALVLMLLAFALPAAATHHLWRMTEIYSNASGSVQYLVLHVDANGEHLFRNQGIWSSTQGRMNEYIFRINLPTSATAGRSLLIATEGFAALGVVAPDYVVPNGFFFTGGGYIDFGSVDGWLHPSLPSNGQAVARDGSPTTPAPINFAGQSAPLPSSTPANFQGLWWGSPAGSESGWGVNLTHQGDILFATWFTYDVDGSGMWLVASDLRRSSGNTYSGPLYRTTGPAFDAAPFDSSRVTVTPVGNATFTFTDENTGTFAYNVGSHSRTKAITRQAFSTPVPRCAATGVLPNNGNVSYQDLWWRASEPGWGVNLAHQGDIVFATWFTYGADGRGQWLVMSDARRTAQGVYAGTIYRTRGPAYNAATWDSSTVVVTPVGTATFTFSDPGNGTFAYTLDGVSQSKAITRQVYSSPLTVCQ